MGGLHPGRPPPLGAPLAAVRQPWPGSKEPVIAKNSTRLSSYRERWGDYTAINTRTCTVVANSTEEKCDFGGTTRHSASQFPTTDYATRRFITTRASKPFMSWSSLHCPYHIHDSFWYYFFRGVAGGGGCSRRGQQSPSGGKMNISIFKLLIQIQLNSIIVNF